MNILNLKYLISSLALFFCLIPNNIKANGDTSLGANNLKERYIIYRDSAFISISTSPKVALSYSQKALEVSKIINDNSHIGYSYILMGISYKGLGKYIEAINSFNLAQEYANLSDDKEHLHSIYNNLSTIYIILEELELAKSYSSKALEVASAIGDYQAIVETKINIGNIYTILEKYQTAGAIYRSAIEDCKTNDSLYKNIPTIYNNIGYSHYCRKEYELAKIAFKESYKGFKAIDDRYSTAILLNNLAEIELINGKYELAEKLIKEAEIINIENDYISSQIDLYETAYEIYNIKGNYKSAIYYLNKYHQLKDSIFNVNLKKELESIKTSYELDKLKAESEIKDISIKHKQKVNNFFYIFSILILIVSAFLYITLIEKTKINKKLKSNNLILKEKEDEIGKNLLYARQIQLACMTSLEINKSNIFIIDLPKSVVGGDFYLIREVKNKTYYVLADCTGHGSSAGFLSILGIQILNFAINNFDTLSEIIHHLNNHFYDYISKSKSLRNESMCLSVVCIEDDEISIAGSLHKVWFYNSLENEIKELQTDRKIIGIEADLEFSTISFKSKPGDKIILSSDGYPDQFSESGNKKLKYPKFRQLLLEACSMSPEEGKQHLTTSLNEWKGDSEQTDDILLMMIYSC